MVSQKPVILALTQTGFAAAQKIAGLLGSAEIHGHRDRVTGADFDFTETITHIRQLFGEGRTIIGVCASGILIRALGPLLADKQAEPPVLAVADDGSAVVPLLGGHHGANDLARKIAQGLDIKPAITTAGDLHFGVALDSPPEGWVLSNPEHAKPFMARLLAGETAQVIGNLPWREASQLPIASDGVLSLVSSDNDERGNESRLVYQPKTLAIGVGCERDCDHHELLSLVEQTLKDNRLSPHSIAAIFSIEVKANEQAILALAKHFDVPARFYSAKALNEEADRLVNPSDIVMREVGCPGVAEGAALAAVGSSGDLIVEKQKSKRATCAIARAEQPIEASACGRPRGKLAIVGIGPGRDSLRTPEASSLLAQAQDWVGYGLYLDLAGPSAAHQTCHRYDLGEEETRVRHALELAGTGRDVALICSGDAGIYAMASLAFELMDDASSLAALSDGAKRIEIEVAPGISALQAAAALSGAPLGHDFCAISLSDLMTPWETIEQRIEAAARGNFVVAFYNPASKRRRWQLERAIEILAAHRPVKTPVILASHLGRPDERIRHERLDNFPVNDVDMMTLVIIGSSATQVITMGDGAQRIYTPRGYHAGQSKTTNLKGAAE